jgi:hypothetical protein
LHVLRQRDSISRCNYDPIRNTASSIFINRIQSQLRNLPSKAALIQRVYICNWFSVSAIEFGAEKSASSNQQNYKINEIKLFCLLIISSSTHSSLIVRWV